MKGVLFVVINFATAFNVCAQVSAVFPQGEKAANVHHVGNVWLSELGPADSVFTYSISQAVFDKGARLDWHSHPGGQILLITDGTGYYQERGKAKQTVRKGDVIKCLPGIEHWHGATHENGLVYIATSPAQKGRTVWLKPVSEDEYKK